MIITPLNSIPNLSRLYLAYQQVEKGSLYSTRAINTWWDGETRVRAHAFVGQHNHTLPIEIPASLLPMVGINRDYRFHR